MEIKVCRSIIQPREVIMASSDGVNIYRVLAPTIFNDGVCDCKGYVYRGTCRHVVALTDRQCKWFCYPHDPQADSYEVCPNCGEDAVWFELDPEFTWSFNDS